MRRPSLMMSACREVSGRRRHAAERRPRAGRAVHGLAASLALLMTLGTGGFALAAAPFAADPVGTDAAAEAGTWDDVSAPAADDAATAGGGAAAPEAGAALTEPASAGDGEEALPAEDDAATSVEPSTDAAETLDAAEPGEAAEPGDGAEATGEDGVETVSALRAAPEPTSSTSVVVVRVVGTRGADRTKQPLAGVRLTGGLSSSSTTMTCTSDAEGLCSFTVDKTALFQGNRNKRLTITYTAGDVPAGWYANTELGLLDSGSSATLSPYRMVSPKLHGGHTYTSDADLEFFGSGPERTTGGWQASVVNPSMPQKCGIKVALLMDLSSSVTAADVAQAQAAANGFVDALTGTPSSIGVYTFGTVAPATGVTSLAATSVSTSAGAQTVKSSIAAWRHLDNEGTNWEQGLWQLQGEGYDVVMLLTDGSPTFYGPRSSSGATPSGPGDATTFAVMEEAIASANTLKTQGTTLIAFGVGSGVSGAGAAANLRAVSGQTPGSDYFQTTDYAAAAAQLTNLASGACHQTVTVIKQTVPYGGSTTPTVADGWTFTAEAAGGVTFAGGATTLTGTTGQGAQAGTGATEFAFDLPWASATGTMTITETQKPGYTLVQQGGANAACYRVSDDGTQEALTVTNTSGGGFTIPVSAQNRVSCYVINREPAPEATVTVSKVWKVDGQDHAGGSPAGLGMSASLQLGGAAATWDEAVTGHHMQDTLTIGETTTITDMPGCRVTGSTLTGTGLGQPVALDPTTQTASVKLTAASNSYTLTNTVTCTQTLSLDKKVDNSASTYDWATQATAQDWTLSAVSGSTTLSGAGAVAATEVPAGEYTLSESAGATLALPAEAYQAGTWQCAYTDNARGTVPVYNGKVTVPRGRSVHCEVTNTLAAFPISWKKVDEGGAALAGAEWQISRDGMSGATVNVPASTDGQARVEGLPMGTYTLTETKAPAGYTRAAPITFTVAKDGTITGLPQTVTNTKRPVPSLPLTGGLGTDMLLVGGGLLAVAALAAEVMRRRHQQMTSQ